MQTIDAWIQYGALGLLGFVLFGLGVSARVIWVKLGSILERVAARMEKFFDTLETQLKRLSDEHGQHELANERRQGVVIDVMRTEAKEGRHANANALAVTQEAVTQEITDARTETMTELREHRRDMFRRSSRDGGDE